MNFSSKTEENSRMGKTRDLFKKLEIQREHFMQRWAQLRSETVRIWQIRLRRGGKNTQNCMRKVLMTG